VEVVDKHMQATKTKRGTANKNWAHAQITIRDQMKSKAENKNWQIQESRYIFCLFKRDSLLSRHDYKAVFYQE